MQAFLAVEWNAEVQQRVASAPDSYEFERAFRQTLARAVRDGDDYVLNGIKRFTSGAHRAEYVWLAAQTDPEAPKHRGISMFLVDLSTPGITVKPIWTMSGLRTNEVYWEDVRVPADALVGEENRGWYYAAHALDFERVSIFTVSGVRAVFDALVSWARTAGPDGSRPIERAGGGALAGGLQGATRGAADAGLAESGDDQPGRAPETTRRAS